MCSPADPQSCLQIATAEEFANAGDVIMSPEVARTLLNHCEVELLERDNARLISMHTTAEVLTCLLAPVHALLPCRGPSTPMHTTAGVCPCPPGCCCVAGWLCSAAPYRHGPLSGGPCVGLIVLRRPPWTDKACLLLDHRRHAACHDAIA